MEKKSSSEIEKELPNVYINGDRIMSNSFRKIKCGLHRKALSWFHWFGAKMFIGLFLIIQAILKNNNLSTPLNFPWEIFWD